MFDGRGAVLKGKFKPSLTVTAATAGFVALTVALGNWQLRRADEKLARVHMFAERQLQPALDLNTAGAHFYDRKGNDGSPGAGGNAAGAMAWRRVQASGAYLPQDELLIDNRIHNHIPGYHVIAPLEVSGSHDIVLVNRGWMAARPDRAPVEPPPLPHGPVKLEGIAAVPEVPRLPFMHMQYPPPGRGQALWPNLDLNQYRKTTGLAVLPFVIEQTSEAADGLVRDWPAPPNDVPMHKAYALQWYTFAGIALVLYVALNFKRRRA